MAPGGSYPRRLAGRVGVCCLLGLLLPQRQTSGAAFVSGPNSTPRLRGSPTARWAEEEKPAAGAQPGNDEEDRLRQRVAELEKKLAGGLAARGGDAPAGQPQAMPMGGPQAEASEVVRSLMAQAMEDLAPELADIQDARMGMTDNKQYVFSQNADTMDAPIYKRKYAVLGMTIKQQEAYMAAFKRCLKKAKETESVKKLVTLYKEGGEGLTRKQVKFDCDRLRATSPQAATIVRDILPELTEDLVQNTVVGLVSTAVLIILVLLLCLCLAPPIIPIDDE